MRAHTHTHLLLQSNSKHRFSHCEFTKVRRLLHTRLEAQKYTRTHRTLRNLLSSTSFIKYYTHFALQHHGKLQKLPRTSPSTWSQRQTYSQTHAHTHTHRHTSDSSAIDATHIWHVLATQSHTRLSLLTHVLYPSCKHTRRSPQSAYKRKLHTPCSSTPSETHINAHASFTSSIAQLYAHVCFGIAPNTKTSIAGLHKKQESSWRVSTWTHRMHSDHHHLHWSDPGYSARWHHRIASGHWKTSGVPPWHNSPQLR